METPCVPKQRAVPLEPSGGRDGGCVSLQASVGKVPEQGGRGRRKRPFGRKGAGVESQQCSVPGSTAGQHIQEAAVLELQRSAAAAQ